MKYTLRTRQFILEKSVTLESDTLRICGMKDPLAASAVLIPYLLV